MTTNETTEFEHRSVLLNFLDGNETPSDACIRKGDNPRVMVGAHLPGCPLDPTPRVSTATLREGHAAIERRVQDGSLTRLDGGAVIATGLLTDAPEVYQVLDTGHGCVRCQRDVGAGNTAPVIADPLGEPKVSDRWATHPDGSPQWVHEECITTEETYCGACSGVHAKPEHPDPWDVPWPL